MNSSDGRPSYALDNHHSSDNVHWREGRVASMKQKGLQLQSNHMMLYITLNISASCVLFSTHSYCNIKQLKTMLNTMHMANLHSTATD